MSKKYVYSFGNGKAEGKGDQKELLGGKGAGLAEMTRIGLPVPEGFTITTEACEAYNQANQRFPAGLEKEVRQKLAQLERTCRKKLGAAKDPLLVSVRSGAARSMPGMMETILNLGLNDQSVEGLAEVASDPRFAFDSYRRLIMMYAATANGIERALFDDAFEKVKREYTAARLGRSLGEKVLDTDMNADELKRVVSIFKTIYHEHVGSEFPQDPLAQLKGAISAVFDSWMAKKAVTYRWVENITGMTGTAVNICRMVFGNMGEDCGTGVCFTRDPSTGESCFYGDLLINAQGEDVVAGVRTPLKLEELKTLMPDVYDQLEAVRIMLEVHYKDMQDLEFTIERGKLYMLQCRVGKRSPQAAFKIAVDQATKPLATAAASKALVKKKYLPAKYAAAASKPILAQDEAVGRIQPTDIERLFYPILSTDVPEDELSSRKLGAGIGAVPGAACGQVAFTAEDAEAVAGEGKPVVLVRRETSPEDVGGMHAAVGVLTATGGKTSHAAVVARGWGKCCIVGCDDLHVDYEAKTLTFDGRTVHEGESITLDGSSGCVYEGEIPLDRPAAPPEYQMLMNWCDKRRRLGVRTNADTPDDARKAIEFGAEGIGLCRTEHMFFDSSQPQRLRAMRQMILAEDEPQRRRALDQLLPFQQEDFEGIFTAMDGKPVTVRLLDPPLHEFLPGSDNPEAQKALADELDALAAKEEPDVPSWSDGDGAVAVAPTSAAPTRTVVVEDIQRRVAQLHEANPMLGHRGCRLCITYPEILEMQVRAIIQAAVRCAERGIKVRPEIMIPLTIDAKELRILVDRVHQVADEMLRASKSKVKYLVGTMVETPRAALTADRMAQVSEFFSFGTNDLTQMTMGLSRDDAGRFLPDYVDEDKAGIFPHDPFQTIDIDGVGMMVEMACELGRGSRQGIKLGVCGEHGGDPTSVRFFHEIGLDYVSCSPYRVPIARLVAAQAAMEQPDRPSKRKSATPAPSAKPGTARQGKPKAPKVGAARRKTTGRAGTTTRTRGAGAAARGKRKAKTARASSRKAAKGPAPKAKKAKPSKTKSKARAASSRKASSRKAVKKKT